MRLGFSSWREQLVEAVLPNGSCEAAKEVSWAELVFHVVCVPWKLFFVPIPPTAFLRGWVCFFFSLGYIAFLTAIIGDMAEIFGCVLEIPDLVTGVSFVALGTSMPDLFASRHAAVEDPTADAAIINVTGSNSVNVFLGIGIPWSVG
ncbi:Slc8a1, partial [Symbiodinium necroappetens]